MQECVDSIGTLHHDHVTTVLQHLQEGHKEDLTEKAKQKKKLDFGIINTTLNILCQGTGLSADL